MVITADRQKRELSVQVQKRRQVKIGGARVKKKNGFNLIN
jgi:hypothetical protein